MFGTQYASIESSNELLSDMPGAQPFGMSSAAGGMGGDPYPNYNSNQSSHMPQQYRHMPQMASPGQMNYQTMPQQSQQFSNHYGGQPCGPCGEGQPTFQQEFNDMMSERQFDNFNPHAQGRVPGFNPNRRSQSRRSRQQSRRRSRRQSQLAKHSPILNMIERSINSVMTALGVEPDWADLTEDGGAIWKQSSILEGKSLWGRVFSRVEVAGKNKPCPKSVPHYGCITTQTNMKLDAQLAAELQQELPMISYCPSTNLLSITMDTLEHNLAMLALVCGVQQDKLSFSKVKYYDLVKKYLGLTTPGNRRYRKGAKYSLVKFIHDRK